MLTTQEKIKECLIVMTFNILLPSADVYSDIYLMTNLFLGIPRTRYCQWHLLSEQEYADCMEKNIATVAIETFPLSASFLLGPCLINYGLCWLGWYSTEKRKKFSWIAPLLNCYPQLVAARIILLIWIKPSKGMREKRHLERNLMENRVSQCADGPCSTYVEIVQTIMHDFIFW